MAYSLKNFAFSLAVLAFSLFSSSTPDGIGLGELIVFLLLLVAIFSNKMTFNPYWLVGIILICIFGFMSALIGENSPSGVFRDLVAFLLILSSPFLLKADRSVQKYLPFIFILAGFFLSFRYVAGATRGSLLGGGALFGDKDFLSADPLNMVAVLFLPTLLFGRAKMNIIVRLSFIGFSLFCLLVSAASMLRGVLFFFVIQFIFVAVVERRFFLLIVASMLPLMNLNFVFNLIWLVVDKTLNHGLATGKEVEVQSLLLQMNFYEFFIGSGFGSTFYNPVLHSDVRFVHMAFFGALFKFGVFGIVGFVLLFYKSVIISFSKFNVDRVLYLYPFAFVVFYNLIYQSTYKSVSFPFVLSAVLVMLGSNNFLRYSRPV